MFSRVIPNSLFGILTMAVGTAELEMFATVARHRSFRSATAVWGVSAAALSDGASGWRPG